jgi:hypothetical protein
LEERKVAKVVKKAEKKVVARKEESKLKDKLKIFLFYSSSS